MQGRRPWLVVGGSSCRAERAVTYIPVKPTEVARSTAEGCTENFAYFSLKWPLRAISDG